MEKKKVIYKSRKKAGVIAIIGLLLAFIGWLFLTYTTNAVAGWSFVILAVFCLLFGFGSSWDRQPMIILTDRGITDMTTLREEIEWDAIRYADEIFYRGQYFIRILVDRDYKPALVQPTWFRRFDRLYEQEGVKAIFIRVAFLDVTSMKLSYFINQMMKADAKERIELLDNFDSLGEKKASHHHRKAYRNT